MAIISKLHSIFHLECVQETLAFEHENDLMNIAGAVGSAIGTDGTGQPVIYLYLKKLTPEAKAAAPNDVEGIPLNLVESGDIVAY